MSLSDRLAQAARLRENGGREPAPENWLAAAPPAESSRGPVMTIVLPAEMGLRVVAAEPDPSAEPGSVCPTCCRTGVLSLLDLPGCTAHWACDACGTMWRVDLDADSRSRLASR